MLVPGSHHGGWSFEPLTRRPRREYVYAAGWAEGPFGPVAERLRHDSAWNVHTLRSGHNLMRDVPDELFRIVAGAGAR